MSDAIQSVFTKPAQHTCRAAEFIAVCELLPLTHVHRICHCHCTMTDTHEVMKVTDVMLCCP